MLKKIKKPHTLAHIDLKTKKSPKMGTFIMKPFTSNQGTGKVFKVGWTD